MMAIRLGIAATIVILQATAGRGQTPAQAYALGCGGCHTSERTVLRRIPRATQAERRIWIERFMANHPCERDSLKPLILDYLVENTRS